MNNPILFVRDAGYGETPQCPEAIFAPGDVVHWKGMGDDYIVAVAVPPRFPAEYALADLTKTPRPLMITQPSSAIQYILVRKDDQKPYLAREKSLKSAGKAVDLGTVLYTEEPTP